MRRNTEAYRAIRLMTAVRDHDIHGPIGHRQILDFAEPELDVTVAPLSALARALETIAGVMSTPMTRPVSPT